MTAVHLIIKSGSGLSQIEKVAGEPGTYTSGYWTLSLETARSFIGRPIYFHEHQRDPSFYGGTVLDAVPTVGGEYPGKIVFKFKYSEDCKNVKTGQDGWSQEMKFDP